MDAALRMLARRARSEAEIRQGLERGGFGASEVRRVLGRLREIGYVDDPKLAADWSDRLQARGFGSLRIRLELQQRGIQDLLAERVAPDRGEERLTAAGVLRSRFGSDRITDPRRKAKAARLLSSRGFPPEVVESVLDSWEE